MKQLEAVPGLIDPNSDGARRPRELRRHTVQKNFKKREKKDKRKKNEGNGKG
jgi:hypothetical protein